MVNEWVNELELPLANLWCGLPFKHVILEASHEAYAEGSRRVSSRIHTRHFGYPSSTSLFVVIFGHIEHKKDDFGYAEGRRENNSCVPAAQKFHNHWTKVNNR